MFNINVAAILDNMPASSAINAAYFNGLAGDILLKKKKGFTYLASDLVTEISNWRKWKLSAKAV